jgi:ABC-type branched-subunit amino acid transport system substrate-binding protein
VAAQNTLTLRQSRGRQIYIQGASSSGKDILAYIGDASLEVPGSSMSCASCHGLDGRGKAEGGIVPSNLTWEFLSKPYGLKHADGRQHPPYTIRALELAITRGLDPAGNRLLNAMPRYSMSPEDLSDLVAYLQIVGNDAQPGITDNKILIGTLVPTKGNLTELGIAASAATKAVFEELNAQGGIFGRRLELEVIETVDTPAATREKVEPLLKDQHLFAMSGAVIAGFENDLLPLFAQQETPLIGPLTLYPQTSGALNRQVFYLLSGLDGQARSLINFVAGKPELKDARLAVVHQQTALNATVTEAIEDQKKKAGSSVATVVSYAAGSFDAANTVKQIKASGAEVLFFLGGGDEGVAFMKEAEKLNWFPALLVPGGSIGATVFAAPVGFDRKIFFSFPTAPADQTEAGLKEFRVFAEKYELPPGHLAVQISAFSAARILAEAIKRSGRDVSREKLIQVLESLHQYPTGLTAAISFGPNRRVGATGAHVVSIDLKAKQFVPEGGWIDSN